MASPYARLSPEARLVALVFYAAGARDGEWWLGDVPTLLAQTNLSSAEFTRALIELRLAACLSYTYTDRECLVLKIRLARVERNERTYRWPR